MTKVLYCDDVMPGCDAVIEGEDDSEVMTKASEHAREEHGVGTISADIERQVQGAIREK